MKKIIKLLIIISIFILVILFGINIYIKYSVSKNIVKNIDDVDYILVLGASVQEDSVSLMLKDRLDKAYEVYNATKAKIILSGDSVKSNEYDEVGKMKTYLLNNGINEEDLILYKYGISTYDSIYRIKDITKNKKVVIITQKYHLYRALYIANSLDINSYGIYSQGDNYFGQEYREFREVLARVKDYVKCLFKPTSKYSNEIIYEE